jgi:hypothetical protein
VDNTAAQWQAVGIRSETPQQRAGGPYRTSGRNGGVATTRTNSQHHRPCVWRALLGAAAWRFQQRLRNTARHVTPRSRQAQIHTSQDELVRNTPLMFWEPGAMQLLSFVRALRQLRTCPHSRPSPSHAQLQNCHPATLSFTLVSAKLGCSLKGTNSEAGLLAQRGKQRSRVARSKGQIAKPVCSLKGANSEAGLQNTIKPTLLAGLGRCSAKSENSQADTTDRPSPSARG